MKRKTLLFKIHDLNNILEIEWFRGMGCFLLGIHRTLLKIPMVASFKNDVLMFVANDSKYRDRLPMQVVTIHICSWM